MIADISSVCTYCGVGCDITAQVEDNKILKIYAQNDGYVSQGKLCIKGSKGFGFVASDERIRNTRVKKSFIEKNFKELPRELKARAKTLKEFDKEYFEAPYEFTTSLAAWKLTDIKQKYGRHSFCGMGGARTSCESSYMFQKFIREAINSPHVDCCARVCHSPSLKGMKPLIGEGAATNPFDDIYETENIIIMGSNTTEAHPIVANRIIKAAKAKTASVTVIDVRNIQIGKYGKEVIIPYEANLLVLNMMAYVILNEKLYDNDFIDTRCVGFEEYKDSILNDPFANPEFMKKIEGYEYLADTIPEVAREYAKKKSMFFWGLGVTEHLDGSYAVMAIVHLSLLTGNIGKTGTGLMPLRGQNNVQGACDTGCLPYFDPDYEKPKEIGLMTPQLIDEMLKGNIKAMYVMGEDIAHIHPNQNKVHKALENLELIISNELFMNEISKKADIVFGVKSAYEKTGVYVNAMRRLHLSQPLVQTDLPDDWEVLRDIENKINGEFIYETSEDVWNETREKVKTRFNGATYHKLSKNRNRGMQWPIEKEDTPILHIEKFRTQNGKGYFQYHRYKLREQIKKLVEKETFSKNEFYLTTGRTIVHYNNSAQTIRTEALNSRYDKDIVLASKEDEQRIGSKQIIIKTQYGQTAILPVKYTKNIRPGTLYTTFHHPESKINFIFGDEADELILTARFKSIRVEIEPV
ncbi:molybdopterin oxidoreductase family protein [Halarcobacter anaerophilus]|uniref:Formate dehydrogenase n=1 Tax=Halarcobacter anaerophilus TaxID=877500 RepID=A0A4Q0XZH9_9BACT|nr:molybdopterin-dependent oxidoreductase [Halarcobacter anaerophilus]QDF30064.1 formate dehydrogenase H, cysteine-containing [Halarcobacter anaerophilus]RXJ63110.1 formate dehydrogenase [Halarcobacter anaerophilus]